MTFEEASLHATHYLPLSITLVHVYLYMTIQSVQHV